MWGKFVLWGKGEGYKKQDAVKEHHMLLQPLIKGKDQKKKKNRSKDGANMNVAQTCDHQIAMVIFTKIDFTAQLHKQSLSSNLRLSPVR